MHADEWKAGRRDTGADAWKAGQGAGSDGAGSPDAAGSGEPGPAPGQERRPRGYWTWPVGLVCAFLLVVGVNVLFVYVAVSGADEVVESYAVEER